MPAPLGAGLCLTWEEGCLLSKTQVLVGIYKTQEPVLLLPLEGIWGCPLPPLCCVRGARRVCAQRSQDLPHAPTLACIPGPTQWLVHCLSVHRAVLGIPRDVEKPHVLGLSGTSTSFPSWPLPLFILLDG